jgi:hypothetical protein
MPTSQTLAPQNLYRIVSFDRAVQLLKSNELYFAHPSEWDDPYEQGLQHKNSHDIFAQCWCRKAQSDAMWRIYSPHGVGVRIGTTRKRLRDALAKAKEEQGIWFKIQSVQYLYQEELQFKLRDSAKALQAEYSLVTAVAPLFLKRNAFSHEAEVRAVIHVPGNDNDAKRKGVTVKVDAHALLRSIWLDPRAPSAYVEAFTYYLKRKLKFTGTVEKSGLYAALSSLER